jgi:hypothetical protein
MPRVRKISEQELREIETTSAPRTHVQSADRTPSSTAPFDDAYPQLANWVYERGWIEIGADENSRSFIRVLDIGGMVWEGKTRYPSIDTALRAADTALARLEAAGEL